LQVTRALAGRTGNEAVGAERLLVEKNAATQAERDLEIGVEDLPRQADVDATEPYPGLVYRVLLVSTEDSREKPPYG
jgi:hypothetical protein